MCLLIKPCCYDQIHMLCNFVVSQGMRLVWPFSLGHCNICHCYGSLPKRTTGRHLHKSAMIGYMRFIFGINVSKTVLIHSTRNVVEKYLL